MCSFRRGAFDRGRKKKSGVVTPMPLFVVIMACMLFLECFFHFGFQVAVHLVVF